MQTAEQRDKFNKLIEQNLDILLKVARTYSRNQEDRQDLIQETMIQIWQSIHTYNEKFAITTWMYRVSINVAISFYRKNGNRRENFVPVDEDFHVIQTVDHSEKEKQLDLLEKFINQLKEIDKALILLYLEDKGHAEIADILGISASNVSTRLGRIKEQLRKRFTQQNFLRNE